MNENFDLHDKTNACKVHIHTDPVDAKHPPGSKCPQGSVCSAAGVPVIETGDVDLRSYVYATNLCDFRL
jgi:hypothetical protein